MKEITVKSNKENLYEVLSKIDEEIEPYDLPMKFNFQLQLVIEELFVNICNYAYEDEGDITIQYCIEENPSRIVMNFIDTGVEFNPLNQESPDLNLSVEEREIGGLGLTLVRKNVDEIKYDYKHNQNILTIEKIF